MLLKNRNRLSLVTREAMANLKKGVTVLIISWRTGKEIGEGVITSPINKEGKSIYSRQYTGSLEFEVLLQEPYTNNWKPGYYGFNKHELIPISRKSNNKGWLAG